MISQHNKIALKRAALAMALCLAGLDTAVGQNMIVANPAEVSDFRSTFVNPAALSFHKSHVVLGGKLFHLGFIDEQSSPFRQGFVSLALPFAVNSEMGVGLTAQYFNTPIFSQSNISVSLARRFRNSYALGVKFNLFSKAFNRANFDLVDQDDPVFRNGTSQWSATFGAGLMMFPLPYLSLGVGIDHINRANISLTNDSVYQPLKSYFGAVLTVGLLQASVSAVYEEGRFLPRASLSSAISGVGHFKLGYSERAMQAEGQLRISGPLSLNYTYEYTLFDNQGFGQGSHQVALIHEFGRKRDVPRFEMPDDFVLKFQPPARSESEEARFYLYPTVNKLEIVEKRLTRVVDSDLDAEALAQLSKFDLGVLDSSRAETSSPFKKAPINIDGVPAVMETNMSHDYLQFVHEVAEDMTENQRLKTTIVAPKTAYLRAARLRKLFSPDSLIQTKLKFAEPVFASRTDSLYASQKLENAAFSPRETLVSLSAPGTAFQIIPISITSPPASWRVVVENKLGQVVKQFDGKGAPPSQVEWDWRDSSGQLIGPGLYSCYLTWRDRKGRTFRTDEKVIFVQKLLRHITIEVTKKPKKIGADVDEIEIILKK
ncbi:MAG: type IX secretion system membrane protein PorP/SprF [Calditrichaeota bacterium]|nr:MAG: type IX secretion system membrane protein PorP/SprF [Calditrichota bacterium]